MKYHWIENIKDFQLIAEEWDSALFSSGSDNPFLLADFIITWWKHYCRNKRLMIFCVYENDRIIAGIPLYEENKKFLKIVSYIGACAANVTHFLLKKSGFNAMECLISSLGTKKDWDILVLDRVLSNDTILEGVKNVSERYSDKFFCDILDAGFEGKIDLTLGYKSVLNHLPNRLYRHLKSNKKRLSKIGELRLSRVGSTSNIVELFDEYRDLSIKSFNMRNDISAFKNRTFSNFFRELLVTFDKKTMLDAYRLALNDITLGIGFGYRFKKGFKWILSVFNPDFQQWRPGHLLIEALVQEAINNGDPYINMYYGGDLLYKRQWCAQLTPLKRIEIYKKNFINRAIVLTERRLRANSFIFNSAKKTAQLFNKFLNRTD